MLSSAFLCTFCATKIGFAHFLSVEKIHQQLPIILLLAAAGTDRRSSTGNRDAQQPLQVSIHWDALHNVTVCNSVPAPHYLLYA